LTFVGDSVTAQICESFRGRALMDGYSVVTLEKPQFYTALMAVGRVGGRVGESVVVY